MDAVTCGISPAGVHTISTVGPQDLHSPLSPSRVGVLAGAARHRAATPGRGSTGASKSGKDRGIVLAWRRCGSAGVLALSLYVLVGASPALEARRAAPRPGGADPVAPALPWFRLFLLDGQILSTIGEFTRVDEVVLLQVPVGPPGASGVPEPRTVSIAARDVDWARTEAYRESLRRAQFEEAGGARAYAAFTEEVAATLRDVALLVDPLERIGRLEAARAQLAQWPAAHHGYRAEDVAQTLSVVDDLIAGMRAATGQQSFSLALSTAAVTAPPVPAPPLLPPPTLQELITQALGLAPRVSDASERLLLLQSAEAMLASAPDVDRRWASTTRGQVRRQIKQETTVTGKYARLRTWMLEKTTRLLAVADVRGLMRTREELASRDARLGRQRPAEMASLLGTLDTRLETARRHRLLLERWTERRAALEAYATSMAPYLTPSAPLLRALEDIKALSGPDPAVLLQAEGQLANVKAAASRHVVPEEARAAQLLWQSAQQLAMRAMQSRRAAIRSGDLQQAWEASAAAAGALLLLQQLRTDVPALARPPALPVTGL